MMKPFFLFNRRKTAKHQFPHDALFNQLRAKEYARIDKLGHTYLDYTGGNLYGHSQVKRHHDWLGKNILGNPHSTNPTSQLATSSVKKARAKVLDYFNATADYYCVFTQNATGALKIVGECYPFEKESQLILLSDNHNSVNGIREFCTSKGGQFAYCPIQYEDLCVDDNRLQMMLETKAATENRLFCFPAQSNVSGVKHNLAWILKAQSLGWDVLLDAAAYVPTSRLDLSEVRPDFVCVSFYKIFGYPTGLGCLLVRKDKFHKLRKPWFAGGTVTLVSVASPNHYLTEDHERFEDGTINYLDIPAIQTGLEFIESVGIDKINERVLALTEYLYQKLKEIQYPSGLPVVQIFGPDNRRLAGATLLMNFFDENGQAIPFDQVEKKANQRMISIRSGCFCNPGIDEIKNCVTNEELARYFSSRDRGDYHDMIDFLGKMRGATRISLGIASNQKDLDRFLDFVRSFTREK